MTVTIPQLVAEGLTTAAIDIGAKTVAVKLARARAAAQVAAFFTAAGQGNITQANQQVQTLIAGITDAGLEQTALDLWSIGQPFLSVQYSLAQNVPILGGSLESAFTAIGAGMASVAGAYIGKYGTPAPAA
jgi:hypothetical protein